MHSRQEVLQMSELIAALSVIAEQTRHLGRTDLLDVFELFRERVRETSPDELRSIDRAIAEIVENKPVTARRLI